MLRIGVNLGDVMVEGSDLYGDGVNLAARLEGLAEPGGICLSEAAHHQVAPKLRLGYRDLGEKSVKNFDRPVRVYSVDTGAAPAESQATAPMRDKPAIVVLPFANMSGDPEQEFFADGLTEDVITELSRFRDLLVISRNTSTRYKGKAVEVKKIARELAVELLARRQRPQAGQPRARHRAADRRRGRSAYLGRSLRPGSRGHLRHPGRGDVIGRRDLVPARGSRDPRAAAWKPTKNMVGYECVLAENLLHHRSTEGTSGRDGHAGSVPSKSLTPRCRCPRRRHARWASWVNG